MATAECESQRKQLARESARLRKYREGMKSDVLAIHNQFDAKISKEIGFSGNIFDALHDGLVVVGDDSLVLRDIPKQLQDFVDEDKKENPMFAYHSEGSIYMIQTELYQSRVDIVSNTSELHYTRPRMTTRKIGAVSAEVSDYTGNPTPEPTKRVITFANNSKNPYEVFSVGQKREGVIIAPLVYGNLDEQGNAYLHLDQPINADGALVTTELTDKLTVTADDKRFYYPLSVHWRQELAGISEELFYE